METGPGLIAVTDCGPGLDQHDLTRAFERYALHDRHKATGRQTGGAGIGLALVKELTETMGGSVAVAPAPGAGSVFTVLLPVSAEAASARPAHEQAVP